MKRLKTFLFFLLILLDILIIPSIIIFPVFFKKYGISAPKYWLDLFKYKTYIEFIKRFYRNKKLLKIWLWMQLGIVTLLFSQLTKYKEFKTNKKSEGPKAAGNGQFGTSRWQTEDETDETTTVWNLKKDDKPIRGGMILGMDEKKAKAWIDSDDTHTLIIGTTGSGKTRRAILPTIWELGKMGESIVMTDPKGELYDKTSDYLKDQGYDIVLIDFRNPQRGNRWNPMNRVIKAAKEGDISSVSEYAFDIAHSIVYQKPQNGEPIWPNGEESVIASLIELVALEAENDEQKHMTSVYQTLFTLGCCSSDDTLPPIVDYMNSLPKNHPARRAFANATLAAPNTRSSFFASAATSLRLWSLSSVANLTAVQDHDLSSIGKKKTAVYLIIPDEKTTMYSLASLYIDQTYLELVEYANKCSDSRLPVRVNFLLDEFGNLPTITDFGKKITVARSRRIRFTLVVQDFAQIKDHYKESAKTIKGNCHTWMYLLTTDVDTAKEIAEKTGKYTVETPSQSNSVRGSDITIGSSHSYTGRSLLDSSEVQRFKKDKALILRARQYPVQLLLPDLSRWKQANKDLVKKHDNPQIKNNFDINIWTPSIIHNGEDTIKNEIENSEDDILDNLN